MYVANIKCPVQKQWSCSADSIYAELIWQWVQTEGGSAQCRVKYSSSDSNHRRSIDFINGHDRQLNFKSVVFIIIYPLTARVVGAPQMILQPVSSIFPCSSLPSATCRTPGLSIPWCCLGMFLAYHPATISRMKFVPKAILKYCCNVSLHLQLSLYPLA